MRAVEPPDDIRSEYGTWSWSVAWSYQEAITTWRLVAPEGHVRFLKVRAAEEEPILADEAARLRWAGDHLSVPVVIDFGTEGDVDWLLLAGLPGRDATAPELKSDPARLVPVLAEGLRRFHEAPVGACPFRLTVEAAIASVRRRVANGLADHADLHAEHSHLSLDGVVATIERLAPYSEDLVVCHGDYCFPNVLIEDGAVSSYLDLGELNVADRWWDLAVASWSTQWNIGPGWERPFLDAYGIEPNEGRMRFWRLVYDLIS